MDLSTWLEKQSNLLRLEECEDKKRSKLSRHGRKKATSKCDEIENVQVIEIGSKFIGQKTYTVEFPRMNWYAISFKSGEHLTMHTGSDVEEHVQVTIDSVQKNRLTLVEYLTHHQSTNTNPEADEFQPGRTVTLRKNFDASSYKQLRKALDDVEDNPQHPILKLLYSNLSLNLSVTSRQTDISQFYNSNLDKYQIKAIQYALGGNDVSVIHGPPGTGKTTTLIELILQAVIQQENRLLVCAPSNIAIDIILEKLLERPEIKQHSINLLRIGHPSKILSSVRDYSFFVKREHSIYSIRKKHWEDRIGSLSDNLKNFSKCSFLPYYDKQQTRTELRMALSMKKSELKKIDSDIVNSSQIVFSTNVGAACYLLDDQSFDLVIIDEAAQALELSCYIPILKSNSIVLAGDHRQLAPTVKSQEALVNGFGVTLFDKLIEVARSDSNTCDEMIQQLKIQYRMHEDICSWSSHAMYDDQLISAKTVANRRIGHLSTVHDLPIGSVAVTTTRPENVWHVQRQCILSTLFLLDTESCGLTEESDVNGSKRNPGEALLAEIIVKAFIKIGVPAKEIAVVSPYGKQVELILQTLSTECSDVEVRSIDGFQGCEREAVVLSMVRSNTVDSVGFLDDERRMNVAITRARRHVTIIGDSKTLKKHEFLKGIINHFEKKGVSQHASEILNGYIYKEGKFMVQKRTDTVREILKLGSESDSDPLEKMSELLIYSSDDTS